MALPECTEEELQALYEWVDSVPLSRPKKSISRDFSDGVLMAELVHHYFPKLVELHNYSPAHNSVQKMYNWSTLNQKVFKRMGFSLAREHYQSVVNADAGAIERVLKLVRARMARFQEVGAGAPRATSRQGSGVPAGTMPVAIQQHAPSSSQPGSPSHFAAPRSTGSSGAGAAHLATCSTTDYIAALRLSGGGGAGPGDVPSKLLSSRALGGPASPAFLTVDQAVAARLAEKEQQLEELRDVNEILETKISKLEQLVRLKDAKIQALLGKLQATAEQHPGTGQQQQQHASTGTAPAAGAF